MLANQQEIGVSPKTFTALLRDFIIEHYAGGNMHRRLFFLTFISVAFKHQGRNLRFATYSQDMLRFVEQLLRDEYKGEAEIVQLREMSTLTIQDRLLCKTINADLEQFFMFNPANLANYQNREDYYQIVKTILSGLFLGCGVIANPEERYSLEFSIAKRSVSLWFGLFLSEINLEPGRVYHQGSEILYLKDGEKIADFLRFIGADSILLKYEQIRVQKDMRNRVNRIVNCDSANAQRMANSAARQINNILYLREHRHWLDLSEDLRSTAELRLRYPEYSLKDLAREMDPPLGKSGLNHRLRKLDAIADDWRERDQKDQALMSEFRQQENNKNVKEIK